MRGFRTNGDELRQCRYAFGWTQEHLAHVAGCDVKTVRRAEQGMSVDQRSLTIIANALNLSPSELLAQQARPISTAAANARVVNLWQQAIGRRDVDGLLRLCHADAVLYAPGSPDLPFGGEFRGRLAIRRMKEAAIATAMIGAIAPRPFTLHAIDDWVYVQGKVATRPAGRGARHESRTLQLFRLRAQKVILLQIHFDSLAVYRALRRGASSAD